MMFDANLASTVNAENYDKLAVCSLFISFFVIASGTKCC